MNGSPLISTQRARLILVLLTCLTFAEIARADVLRDDAQALDPQASTKITALLHDIKQSTGRDLDVVTYEDIPESRRARLQAQGKDEFYNQWAIDEAKRLKTTGALILLVKNAHHVQIVVGNKTRLKAFTLADRDEMLKLVLAQFRQANFDQGLIDAAKFFGDRVAKNTGKEIAWSQPPASLPSASLPSASQLATSQPAATAPSASASTAAKVPTSQPATAPASQPATPPIDPGF